MDLEHFNAHHIKLQEDEIYPLIYQRHCEGDSKIQNTATVSSSTAEIVVTGVIPDSLLRIRWGTPLRSSSGRLGCR